MKRLVVIFLFLSLPLIAAGPEVVATVEGTAITEAEVTAPIAAQLRELRDAEYNLKREAIEARAFELLRERIAAKEGITAAELWKREVEAKVQETTDAEIEATVQQYRQRLPPDDAQAKQIVGDALRQRRIQERERAWRDELLAAADVHVLLDPVRYPLTALPGDAASGPASVPVTIVEFSDFQCPYCASSQPLLDQVEKKYGEQVRIVFKQLPLDIHPQARFGAEASLCAQDQGKFWEMHDWLFANPKSIRMETLKEVSPGLGIDPAELEACLEASRHAAAVDQHIAQAQALGVNSTPTFFINGRKVAERSWAAFSRMIDEELAAKAAKAGPGA